VTFGHQIEFINFSEALSFEFLKMIDGIGHGVELAVTQAPNKLIAEALQSVAA
jgi:hypothetical protein